MKKYFLLAVLIQQVVSVGAQIKGTVRGENNEPLPFASVYVAGTTNGTTTNLNGEYFLHLPAGEHQVVFQYIGYQTRTERILLKAGQTLFLDVVLKPEATELVTVEVKANAEDPAYPIIRKAIQKRKFHLNQIERFTCEVYIKGNVKILSAPKKILGQDIGDLDGSLDSNRQGIVYLSESVSRLYFQQPDKLKEIMYSSKVSGNNQGFSFNSAREMDINLYRNFSNMGRSIISPIAENAISWYRYRLIGTFVDENGQMIHKIQVLPKNAEDPVYQGVIYINQDFWNIHSADLWLDSKASQNPLLDTLFIRQTFVPIQKNDLWCLFSQTFSVKGKILGFRFGGDFTAIYKNYDLNPKLDPSFFDRELMKVENGANEKDSTYWKEIRPMPLTAEEQRDYVVKDSIRLVRESKTYLDSIDKKANRVNWSILLLGYTHQNSWKRQYFKVDSPLAVLGYNTVQGFVLQPGPTFIRYFDKARTRGLILKSKLSYGFSEKKLRIAGSITHTFLPKRFARVQLFGGHRLMQFNELEPVSESLNTSYSLFDRRNYARFFDKKWIGGEYRQEISNGILIIGALEWASRNTLENHSDYSFFGKNKRDFQPNVPENQHLRENDLRASRVLKAGLSVRFRPGQQYFEYPDRRYLMGSKYPDIWIYYRKGIRVAGSDVDFDRISVAVSKSDVSLGPAGVMRFRVEAGKFINARSLFFQDYRHFLGNEITIINNDRAMQSFKMLPYYTHSTRNAWLEVHWEHNFQGFITDKIPVLKKFGWNLVVGSNFLYTSEMKDYTEFSLGLDQLGFGFARFFRFDAVVSFRSGKYNRLGYLFGISLPLDEFEF